MIQILVMGSERVILSDGGADVRPYHRIIVQSRHRATIQATMFNIATKKILEVCRTVVSRCGV